MNDCDDYFKFGAILPLHTLDIKILGKCLGDARQMIVMGVSSNEAGKRGRPLNRNLGFGDDNIQPHCS